jgi:hypothetical protein
VFHPDGWPDWPGGSGAPGAPGAPGGPGDREMRAALEELPPGHPSSARNADGTRRPPPPRLHDLELPLPGTWAGGGSSDDELSASDDPQNDADTGEPPAR